MAIPWMLALRAIPWTTILANAPTILHSANALLTNTKGADVPNRPGAGPGRDDAHALAGRVAALEQRDRETAELLSKLTVQVAALTTASEVLEARLRWLFVLTVATSVVAVTAVGLAWFSP